MRAISTGFLVFLLWLLSGGSLSAAEGGVSPAPYELFTIGSLPVTNSMVLSWAISLLIIIVIRAMIGTPRLIPNAGQAVVENLFEGIRDIIEPIVGKRMLMPTLPLLLGLFTFILIQNWSGLLPGVGAFGFYDETGHFKYWMRPGTADLNMTLALAAIHFVAWLYFVIRYAGVGSLLHHTFGNKADPKEVPLPIYIGLFALFFVVGAIEVVSILFRNVSLPFRLYGNVYGGESLLSAMTGLAGWIVPIPFYFLELLIGLVQALVFVLLVAVYIGLICNHDDEAHDH